MYGTNGKLKLWLFADGDDKSSTNLYFWTAACELADYLTPLRHAKDVQQLWKETPPTTKPNNAFNRRAGLLLAYAEMRNFPVI